MNPKPRGRSLSFCFDVRWKALRVACYAKLYFALGLDGCRLCFRSVFFRFEDGGEF